jgi:hypothetical protein
LYLNKSTTWTNVVFYRKNDGSSPINDVINNYEVNNNFVSNRFNDQVNYSTGFDYNSNFSKKFKKEGHVLTIEGTLSKNNDKDFSTITNSFLGAKSNTTI